jgi:cbb3-type cytochrome oxidase maturation protein
MIIDYVTMMLGVSAFIAFGLLLLVVWAIKGGQFDDKKKMMNSVLFDGEDDLNEIVQQEKKSKGHSVDEKN